MPNHTLLIVDDSSVDLEIISIVCQLLGCEAEVVSDGFDAINRYDPKRHDLVLCDYRMEPINGIYVISKIQEINPQAKCIMVSGFPDAQLRRFVEVNQLHDLIVKPIQTQVLKQALHLALNASDGATAAFKGIALSNRMDAVAALSGQCPQMRVLREQVTARMADRAPFWLVGTSDSAKREIAEFTHQNGAESAGACVHFNCAHHTAEELHSHLIDESGQLGAQVKRAANGTLILEKADALPIRLQQLLVKGFDQIVATTRLILLADAPLEDGLERGTIDHAFYFKVGSDSVEVPAT